MISKAGYVGWGWLFALWALQEGASKVICIEGYPEALEQLRVNLAPEIEDGRVIVIDKLSSVG